MVIMAERPAFIRPLREDPPASATSDFFRLSWPTSGGHGVAGENYRERWLSEGGAVRGRSGCATTGRRGLPQRPRRMAQWALRDRDPEAWASGWAA
jgi:hypothetical protein